MATALEQEDEIQVNGKQRRTIEHLTSISAQKTEFRPKKDINKIENACCLYIHKKTLFKTEKEVNKSKSA